MYKKKTQRLIVSIVAVLLIVAMIIPTILSLIM